MPGALHRFLTADHDRLNALLEECLRANEENPTNPFEEFRSGLLWHIAVEERLFFPRMREGSGEELVRQLHRDHAALAALLAAPPMMERLKLIKGILLIHNRLEEQVQGLYDMVEALAGEDLNSLLERVHGVPVVRLSPYSDSIHVREAIEHLVRKAEEGRRALLSSS